MQHPDGLGGIRSTGLGVYALKWLGYLVGSRGR